MPVKTLIKNIGELVTCSGGVKAGTAMNDIGIMNNVSVIIRDGVIDSIESDEPQGTFDYVIDADGCCVLPGFIDPHTHFIFGGYREKEFEWRLAGESYMEIMQRGGGIANTVAATRAASETELLRTGKQRVSDMLAYGVTTAEGKSGYGLDVKTELLQLNVMKKLNEIQPVDIIPTFMGAHALPPEYAGRTDDYIDYVIKSVLPVCAPYSEFCDVFCEKNVFSLEQSRRLLCAAIGSGLKIKLHADEIVQFGGAELAAELQATSADHLLCASDAGIKALTRSATACVLLPATAFSLRERYARARWMIDNGAIVALATDFNPGSCCTASIPLVIALATLEMNMTTAEIISALTINAAYAVGCSAKTGSIESGKKADLLILKYPSHKFLSYRIAENCVAAVIKDGRQAWCNNATGTVKVDNYCAAR